MEYGGHKKHVKVIQREWRTIQEFQNYEINLDGVIRKRTNQTQLGTYENQMGLQCIQLRKDGKRYLRSVHALTKRAFPIYFL